MDMDFIDFINSTDCPETPKNYNFDNIVSPLLEKFIQIHFFEDEIIHIRNFAKEVSKQKIKERHYKVDDGSLEKRFFTGFIGELAVNMILGNVKLDLSIGNSNNFNMPDLPKLGRGIKTVEWGKFPIVVKNPKNPEIICILNGNTIFICGEASPEVMKKYSTDDLILSSKLRERNVKTGFYGFENLRFFDKQKVENILKGLK